MYRFTPAQPGLLFVCCAAVLRVPRAAEQKRRDERRLLPSYPRRPFFMAVQDQNPGKFPMRARKAVPPLPQPPGWMYPPAPMEGPVSSFFAGAFLDGFCPFFTRPFFLSLRMIFVSSDLRGKVGKQEIPTSVACTNLPLPLSYVDSGEMTAKREAALPRRSSYEDIDPSLCI